MTLLITYLIFSWLMGFGMKMDDDKMPSWAIWFFPLLLPVILGGLLSKIVDEKNIWKE